MKKNKPYHEMTTSELIRSYIISKLPKGKQKLIQEQNNANNPPSNIVINHIAIILDGVVEDVIRCENRMAALILSEPTFVEFDPKDIYPQIGITKYINGNFVKDKEEKPLLGESEIENLLNKLGE
jgi:hypothetical protein